MPDEPSGLIVASRCRARVAARIRELNDQCKAGLAANPKVKLHTLVIYREDGSLVRSMMLTDLVPDFYMATLSHSVSSISWRDGLISRVFTGRLAWT